MPSTGGAGPGLGHFVHRHLPSAFRHFGVGGLQIHAGDLQIEDGLAVGFVLVMKDGQRLDLVLGA